VWWLFDNSRPRIRCNIPPGGQISSWMRAGGAFNGESPTIKFIDRSSCMTRCTSFEILEVTPLSDAPRHLVVSILWGKSGVMHGY